MKQNKIKTSDSVISENNEEAEKLRKQRNPFSAPTMTEDEERFRETALETLPVSVRILITPQQNSSKVFQVLQ